MVWGYFLISLVVGGLWFCLFVYLFFILCVFLFGLIPRISIMVEIQRRMTKVSRDT